MFGVSLARKDQIPNQPEPFFFPLSRPGRPSRRIINIRIRVRAPDSAAFKKKKKTESLTVRLTSSFLFLFVVIVSFLDDLVLRSE